MTDRPTKFTRRIPPKLPHGGGSLSPKTTGMVTVGGIELPAKHGEFLEHYVVRFNGMEAAKKVGQSDSSACVYASKLLSDGKVRSALRNLLLERQQRARHDADEVSRYWWAIATADARELSGIHYVPCRHCLVGDTLVLLADGRTIPIQALRVGDRVMGTKSEGGFRKLVETEVLAHWKTRRAAYETTLADGRSLVSSGDHRFLIDPLRLYDEWEGWRYVSSDYVDFYPRAGRRSIRPFLSDGDQLVGCGAFVETPPETDEYRRGCLDVSLNAGGVYKSGLKVDSVRSLGIVLPMYDITTGTGDFIANGVVSHNCHGVDHDYQFTDVELRDREREYRAQVREHEQAVAVLRRTNPSADLPEAPLFFEMGGGGYSTNREPMRGADWADKVQRYFDSIERPVPEGLVANSTHSCPACHGDGVRTVWLADTRHLSPEAALIFNGVVQTRDRTEIKVRDRDSAMEKFATLTGMIGPLRVAITPDLEQLSSEQLSQELSRRGVVLDAEYEVVENDPVPRAALPALPRPDLLRPREK